MKRFTAQIRHSYDTILRMCRVQDDTFNFGRKILMALLGLALTVLGAWNLSSVAGLVFALVGCWLLVSLNFPARNRAQSIREALQGEYPTNRYEFYDKHFVLLAKNHDLIRYDRLQRLVEDEQYCYLFINREASYMLEKASLGGQTDAFKAFLSKETGLEWTQPYRLSTFNLKALRRLLHDGKAAGGRK